MLLSHEDARARARARPMRVVVACRFFVQGERDRERVPPGSRDRLIQKSWSEQTSSIGASRGEQIGAGVCQSEYTSRDYTFFHPVAALVASPTVAGAPRSIEGRSPSPRRLPGHRWDGEAPGAETPPLDRLRPRGRRCPLRSRVPGLGGWRSPGDLQVISRWSRETRRKSVARDSRLSKSDDAPSRDLRRIVEQRRDRSRSNSSSAVSVKVCLRLKVPGIYEEASYFLARMTFAKITTGNGRGSVSFYAGGGGRRTFADN